jgi:alcohol-forming fatty acyl-CoA reductase
MTSAPCEKTSGVDNSKLVENRTKQLEDDYLPISEFYKGRSIFITGGEFAFHQILNNFPILQILGSTGSGFMGKVLVEKLLRSCPGIESIYLLMRPKRGHDINERLNDIINGPLFDKLRKERPNDLGKIIPINGDITAEELGISRNDQAILCQKVSVVFHSAATVKFDEKLKLSVTINMLGTKRLVELCQRMTRLEV